MSEVTIKAVQPVLGLADGAVVTVERTPRIDNAIDAGRLVVLDAPAPTPLTGDGAPRLSGATDEGLSVNEPDEPAELPEPLPAGIELPEPSASASRAEWSAFLDQQGIDYTQRTTRDGMRGLWHARNEQD